MATLTEKKRDSLRSNQFAYVDKDGGEHLPINDESHVRNAMARWNQTEFESAAAKEEARKKIVSAAKRHGIEVSEDSNVARPSRSARRHWNGPRDAWSGRRESRSGWSARAPAARPRSYPRDRLDLATLESSLTSMPCRLAALTIFLRARSFAAALSNSVWFQRAIAFRTCDSSLIGRCSPPSLST
jgi:hypothetical protein